MHAPIMYSAASQKKQYPAESGITPSGLKVGSSDRNTNTAASSAPLERLSSACSIAFINGMKKNSTKYAEKYQYFDVSTGKNADMISLIPTAPGTAKYHTTVVTTA